MAIASWASAARTRWRGVGGEFVVSAATGAAAVLLAVCVHAARPAGLAAFAVPIIWWTTTGYVAMLALIAGTVSYLHLHMLVELHGQPGWVAALTPLSVDGMIVAASTTLLAYSRSGDRGGILPWMLLVVGSAASLAANVAVAEPTATGRVIAAWPSFALIAAYKLLMRQVRHSATSEPHYIWRPRGGLRQVCIAPAPGTDWPSGSREVQRQAWVWAQDNRTSDGFLPSGKQIARQYGRHERWGRLVKRSGLAGEFAAGPEPRLRSITQ
jgi:hypothetical protein